MSGDQSRTDRDGGDLHSGSRRDTEGGGARWTRFAGMGMEIAMYTIVLGALGRWVDGGLGNRRPLVAVFLGAIGFCFGMYRLVRMAMAVNRKSGVRRNASGEDDVT